jgi:hypothetical protein
MKNLMIKLVDAIILLAVVIMVIIAVVIGAKAGGAVQAFLFGLGTFILCAFICAFWFCVSGIYHNTKALAEAMK